MRRAAFISLIAFAMSAPAGAQEVFGGVYKHGVDTPFTLYSGEGGADFEAGFRFAPITALHAIGSPSPYLIGSLNTAGDASFAGAGIGWRFGLKGPAYIRPGVGLIVHTGPSYRVDVAREQETDLGSRVLFEPELGLGYQLTTKVSAEASWTHISGARLFNAHQNPGIDMWGVRLNYRL
ncbi:MAG: acyloxyacyl hydrolase [Acetobacteraceae bacterium]|nr:acyloxyacyl hydrolase [Acetobacteraceae bacterium]